MIVAAAACAAAATGCVSVDQHSDPSTKGLAPQELALVTERTSGPTSVEAVHVFSIDGQSAIDPHDWPPRKEWRHWLRPGVHTIVVGYNDGTKHSVHNAEVTVAVEAGHRYHLDGWPPKVKDLTTGKQVQCRVTAAD